MNLLLLCLVFTGTFALGVSQSIGWKSDFNVLVSKITNCTLKSWDETCSALTREMESDKAKITFQKLPEILAKQNSTTLRRFPADFFKACLKRTWSVQVFKYGQFGQKSCPNPKVIDEVAFCLNEKQMERERYDSDAWYVPMVLAVLYELEWRHYMCEAQKTEPSTGWKIGMKDLVGKLFECTHAKHADYLPRFCMQIEQFFNLAPGLGQHVENVIWSNFDLTYYKNFAQDCVGLQWFPRQTPTGLKSCPDELVDEQSFESCMPDYNQDNGQMYYVAHIKGVIKAELAWRSRVCNQIPEVKTTVEPWAKSDKVGWKLGYNHYVSLLFHCLNQHFQLWNGWNCYKLVNLTENIYAQGQLRRLITASFESSWNVPSDFYEEKLKNCLDVSWTVRDLNGRQRSCPPRNITGRLSSCLPWYLTNQDPVYNYLLDTLQYEMEWRDELCQAETPVQATGFKMGYERLVVETLECISVNNKRKRYCNILQQFAYFNRMKNFKYNHDNHVDLYWPLIKPIIQNVTWALENTSTGLKMCPTNVKDVQTFSQSVPFWVPKPGESMYYEYQMVHPIITAEMAYRMKMCDQAKVIMSFEHNVGWKMGFLTLVEKVAVCSKQGNICKCSDIQDDFDSPNATIEAKKMCGNWTAVQKFPTTKFLSYLMYRCYFDIWFVSTTVNNGTKSCGKGIYFMNHNANCIPRVVSYGGRDYKTPVPLYNAVREELLFRHRLCYLSLPVRN